MRTKNLTMTLLKASKIFTIAMLLNAQQLHAQISTDSLLLYMPVSGSAIDISGNNNNGTVNNAILVDDRFGVPNSAYRFNGIDSYIEIPASPSLNKIQTSNVISISAWVNINQWYQGWNVFSIFERYNPTNDAGWLFEANWAGGGLLFLADETNSAGWVGCNYSWVFNEWHYLCLTYDHAQGIANFYVDSNQVAAVPYTAPIFVSDTTSPFVIGRSLAGPDEYSDGLIDDYKIYNRVLTPGEIGVIYTTGIKQEFDNSSFSVYPNPVSDLLEIKSKLKTQHQEYTIADLMGKSILSGNLNQETVTVDVSKLPAGVYFLSIGQQLKQSYKIIKQ